ncbi:MAG: hypothetical protein HY985_10130 [Magnetospirillum sp.]|nr:hypothetical protein [Magnetospirillum sp.]
MTVFSFDEDDPVNPLGRLGIDDVARLPFGALELDRDGRVAAYNDTEPDGGVGARPPMLGRGFFDEVAGWAGGSIVAEEFRKGVAANDLNAVFDCAVSRLPYKVRVHLKISPILGTFWVFIKKLKRQ